MTAQAELCVSSVDTDRASVRARSLVRLYELRYQTAELALALAQTCDLRAALAAQTAHGEILASIDVMEKSHPELT